MEKKYQVFVSSTFRDLKDERQAVIRALLDLGHMPAGMELFPAADEDAWQLIESVIGESDYYLLIIGGRYGSLDAAGLSYTEREYDYAVDRQSPVIAFLHELPETLPRENTETDPATWEKLCAFRKKVEGNHHCKYWGDASDLHSKVVVALTALVKKTPATGWIRADQLPQDFSAESILKLEARIRDLEDDLSRARIEAPPGSEQFAQGDDLHLVNCRVSLKVKLNEEDRYGSPLIGIYEKPFEVKFSWNALFAFVAPIMIQESRESSVRAKIRDFLKEQGLSMAYAGASDVEMVRKPLEVDNEDVHIEVSAIETCLVQFRALGLIQESRRRRSVTDTDTYWALTPYGDSVMVKLRAIRRTNVQDLFPST